MSALVGLLPWRTWVKVYLKRGDKQARSGRPVLLNNRGNVMNDTNADVQELIQNPTETV